MDIHKPKAAHSLREFAVEIGTIICGILIALSLEQAVEAVRRGEEVRHAREALHAEVSHDLATLTLGSRQEPCLERYLDRFVAWAKGAPKPAVMITGRPWLHHSVWDVVKTGAVNHMPLEEQLAYSDFYNAVENQLPLISEGRSIGAEIGGLMALDALTPQESRELLRDIARDRNSAHGAASNLSYFLDRAHSLGIVPGPPDPQTKAQVDDLCHAVGMP